MNEALEKLKAANGNGKTTNSALSSILAGIIVVKLKEYFNIELSAEDAVYLCGGIGIAFGLLAKIVRMKFGKKDGGTALASDTRRGFIRLQVFAVLLVMSALLLALPGCGMFKQRVGVPVIEAEAYEKSMRTIAPFNLTCALQGIELAKYLREKPCITDDERAVIDGFLERFSEVDEGDLNQINQALDDFRGSIEGAKKANE